MFHYLVIIKRKLRIFRCRTYPINLSKTVFPEEKQTYVYFSKTIIILRITRTNRPNNLNKRPCPFDLKHRKSYKCNTNIWLILIVRRTTIARVRKGRGPPPSPPLSPFWKCPTTIINSGVIILKRFGADVKRNWVSAEHFYRIMADNVEK